MITTPLDALCTVPFHEADPAARAAILRRLADTMLYIALDAEPVGDQAVLYTLRLPDGGRAALGCDDEGRLAAFSDKPILFAGMAGRDAAQTLAQADLPLLLNPGAPSEMLLGVDVLSWLIASLEQAAPAKAETTRLGPLSAPDPALVAVLAPALGERLTDMAGMADWLGLVRLQEGHLILVGGASASAQPVIAKALTELLAFLPPLPTRVDVAFTPEAPTTPPPPNCAVVLRLEALPAPPPAPKGPPRLR